MIRTMRICKIASLYDHRWKGGAERQLALQTAGLAASGHRVDVITLAEPGQEETSYVEANDVAVHRIALRNLYFPFGGARKPPLLRNAWHAIDVYNPAMGAAIARKLREIAPDIVITHKLQGLSVAVWREADRQGICTVHALHDHELICPATAMTRGDHLCETPCMPCGALSRTRHALATMPFAVIGPSHNILERHRRFGWFNEMQRTAVMPNALPQGWPEAPDQRRCGTPLRVGFIGRLEIAKGIDTLLEAASRLPAGRIQWHIAGTGDADYVEPLKKQYAALPNLNFYGNVAAASFYPRIDLVVVPSRAHESFCNVVMEAASLGIPAIVTDRGALPERIGDGRYGWSFSAGDTSALAQLLEQCADDPEMVARIGMSAIETRHEHRAETIATRYAAQLATWLADYRVEVCA